MRLLNKCRLVLTEADCRSNTSIYQSCLKNLHNTLEHPKIYKVLYKYPKILPKYPTITPKYPPTAQKYPNKYLKIPSNAFKCICYS